MAITLTLLLVACGGSSGGDDDSSAADDDQAADDDAAADDDQSSDDDAVADDDADDDSATPPPGCTTLQEGLNEHFMVDGIVRSFYLDLPANVTESWPWPIVFNWHGFGDTAENFHTLISDLVNFDDMPFIAITPEDSGMLFDWDIIDGTSPKNREVRLFDLLVAELDKCYGVDPERIYIMGFSFGGGVSDLLADNRGEEIASIATCSGVYGSDPLNKIPYAVADWPELTVANKYVELRLHGGVLDNMVLPFGQYGVNDVAYLNENGHDAIECVHPYIHNMGFLYMGSECFIEFFRDHPLGVTTSPYADGMPADYPDKCSYRPKQ
jgi:pimeloyl-ACP methyl ester carboxylesterase